MGKTRVGVVRGGPGHGYHDSLNSGRAVLAHMPEAYAKRDILLDRAGRWHVGGLGVLPHDLHHHVDVVWNALHGFYGEDGKVQHLFESINMPYSGSTSVPSAVGTNKLLTKEVLRRTGLTVPRDVVVGADEDSVAAAARAFRAIAPPWIVKPASSLSSIGVALVKKFTDLPHAIAHAQIYSPVVLVEEFVRGREAAVGIIENFRGRAVYALPPVHLRAGQMHCPGHFSAVEKRRLEEVAAQVHEALGLRHYSQIDYIVSPRSITVLEVNTQPRLQTNSLVPYALAAVGCSYGDFLGHVLGLALRSSERSRGR